MSFKLDIKDKIAEKAAYQDAAKQRSITISFQRLLKKSDITANALAKKSGQLSAQFKHNSTGFVDGLRLFFESCYLPICPPTELRFTPDDVRKNPAFQKYATVLLAQGYNVRIKEVQQAFMQQTMTPTYPGVNLQIEPLMTPTKEGTPIGGENMPLSDSNVSSRSASSARHLRRA